MRFLMVTTFYPPHHFGGDGTYVRQLSEALKLRGHEVDVVYCYDAYRISGGQNGKDAARAETSNSVYMLESRFGALSPLLTQMTGYPGLKRKALKSLFARSYDVVHFHNLSLVGGAGALPLSNGRLTLFTAHEHWTVCATHIFWKNGKKACDGRTCFSCQIRSGRPPQLWRYTNLLERKFKSVDHIFAPSEFTRDALAEGGITRPTSVLPLFAPNGFEALAKIDDPVAKSDFLYVGRVTPSKGIAELVQLFAQRPQYTLSVVGDGDYLAALQEQAKSVSNVNILGRQPQDALPGLYRRATAVILPSLAPESFGLTTIEGFAQGTPAIVRDAGGAGESVRKTGAGIVYKTETEGLAALDALANDSAYRNNLGKIARKSFLEHFSEQRHVDNYMDRIGGLLDAKHQEDQI